MPLGFQNVPFFPGAVIQRILGKNAGGGASLQMGGHPKHAGYRWVFSPLLEPFKRGDDLGPKRYTHLRSAKGVDPWGDFSLQDTDASSREPSTPGSTPKSGKMPKSHMLQDKGPGPGEQKTPEDLVWSVCVDC